MTAFTMKVSAEVELEARWDVPESPLAAVVFCHPHPRQQGTMTVPLMEKVTAVLVDRGLAVLRFNFRGVGASTGKWGHGIAELDDVAAAVEAAAEGRPNLPLAVAGWSFGAAASLQWQARARSELPWAGIAPPVMSRGVDRLPPPADLAPASRTFIVGDRDQFVTVDEISAYAADAGAQVHVIKGSDHFFYFREERVGEAIADALSRARPDPAG